VPVMKLSLLTAFAAAILLSSCEKKPGCANSMQLTADNASPSVGSTFVITATQDTDEDVYQWSGPGYNETNQSNTVTIDNAKLSQSGWYYCNKSSAECGSSLYDSIYIDVQLLQETPSCSPTNNVSISTSIPGTTFTSVIQEMNSTYNAMSLYASGAFGYPSYTILFNSYNGNTEPKDGTYITKNIAVFNVFDEPNLVNISFIYSSNYYTSTGGQKVHVKHVNGKLQVTFCDVPFASPPYPATTCSAKITEL
jgi:hypothetical protein